MWKIERAVMGIIAMWVLSGWAGWLWIGWRERIYADWSDVCVWVILLSNAAVAGPAIWGLVAVIELEGRD